MPWYKRFWSKVRHAIAAFLAGPGGAILEDALRQAITVAGNVGLSMLLSAGKEKAIQLESLPADGSLKAEQLKDYLRGYALQTGINVTTSLLNYVVETSVQALKAHRDGAT